MTAHASHQPPGRYRFRQLARMEWIKLRSLRSTWLTLAIAVAASAGIALATGSSTTSGGMFVGNTLVGMLIGVLLIGVVGVLAMTSEYTSGTIRATFAAAPRRLRVLAAKAAVVGAVALITGEAAAFLSFFAGGMTLGHGITAPALSQPGALRAIVLTGASLTLIGLFGLGLGAIIRHTAAAITAAIGLLFVILILSNFLPQNWQDHVDKWIPFNAGSQIWTVVTDPGSHLFSAWTGFGVFAGYAVIAIAAGFMLFRKRDA